MYNTQGITNVASVTELRNSFGEVIDIAEEEDGVIVTSNNEPYAVLLTFEDLKSYRETMEEQSQKIEELEERLENGG